MCFITKGSRDPCFSTDNVPGLDLDASTVEALPFPCAERYREKRTTETCSPVFPLTVSC